MRGKQVAAPTELIGTLNPSLSFLRSSEQSRGTTFPGWFLVLLSKLQFMEPLSVIVSYASQLSDAGGGIRGEKCVPTESNLGFRTPTPLKSKSF